MSDLSKQLAALSPEKRELILKKLHGNAKNLFVSRETGIPRLSRHQKISLSFAQERLWFLSQLEGPKSNTYNMSSVLRFCGRLNISALERSLHEIIQRHEILRTRFLEENGEPVQSIIPELSIALPVIDIQHLYEEERTAQIQALTTEEAQKPFDLASVPLLRATLIRIQPEEHLFLFTMHHIISDGWSLGVFVREIIALYEAFLSGSSNPLPDLPIQYADFAQWQRQWLSGKVLETQLIYWKQQLQGLPPVLELPTDRPRPPIHTSHGHVEFFEIDVDLHSKIHIFCQQTGFTLFMVLISTFMVLLSRYSRQEDISVGVPIANRNRSELEALIGFFVNTLVMRGDLCGNPTFLDVVTHIQQVALDAYAHQDVPFEQIVETLQPERNMSHTPLFQVMFALQNTPRGRLALPGVSITPVDVARETARFDLALIITEDEQHLKGELEYNSDLFDSGTILRMINHFKILLEGILKNPQQKIRELPILSETERHQILRDWNDTSAEYPEKQCIHELFQTQVEKTPQSIAAVFEKDNITYQELNRRANQLAHYLRRLGVGPETLVGICVERSLEMIVTILGILKAGGAYLPLDPAYPKERLAFMLSDSQAPLIVTQQHLRTELPEHKAGILCIDTDWGKIAQKTEKNPSSAVCPNNLAYVIYTSGSTGRPKGGLITHKGLSNLVVEQSQRFNIQQKKRVLQFVSFSFDVAAGDIFTTLCSGATLFLTSRESLLPGPDLLNILQKYAISHIEIPASLLRALPEAQLPALETIVVGGEACHPDVIKRWHVGRKFFNAYGPTESTICVAIAEYTKNLQGFPIGRPIANTQIFILNTSIQPVPIGIPGEMYIGGVGLARGYLHRPEMTAEKFIPHPFSNNPGERLYKTGDLACFLPDGNIEFLGRTDHQVKIRGFRIEVEEIETILSQHPDIREVVVLPYEKNSLVAFLTLKQKTSVTSEKFRQFLKTKLPEYMIPAQYVIVDKLPLTPNGKIDRRALSTLEISQHRLQKKYIAPQTLTERLLRDIWADVLETEKIGIHDNFFEIGGHSLLAVRVTSQIQQRLKHRLTLAELFEAPTIAQLAAKLEQDETSGAFTPLVCIQKGTETLPLFCVHPANGQVTFYTEFARQIGNEQPFYGLQAYGLEPSTVPLTSVEEMATHYIKAIRTQFPEIPYLLSGFSIGGIIAYEMAQQLQRQGEPVPILVLFDTLAPHVYRPFQNDLQHFLTFSAEVGNFFHIDLLPVYEQIRGIDIQRGMEEEEFRLDLAQFSPQERLQLLFKCVQHAGIHLPQESLEYLERTLQVHRSNADAVFSYAACSYSGRLILFQAEDGTGKDLDEPALGWQQYVSQSLEVIKISGDHYSIMRQPHVNVMAEKIKSYLTENNKV